MYSFVRVTIFSKSALFMFDVKVIGKTAPMRACPGERTFETCDHTFDAISRRTVGLLDIPFPRGRDMGVGHDFDLLSDIVENQQGVGQEKSKIRQIRVVLLPDGQLLKRSDHVIAQISDGTSHESGKVRHGDRMVCRHELPQSLERVSPAEDAFFPFAR